MKKAHKNVRPTFFNLYEIPMALRSKSTLRVNAVRVFALRAQNDS